jgi:flagellar hook-length control protein FliK
MIHPSLTAGIPDPGPCADCATTPTFPGLEAGPGAFQRVLHALIGGVESKAAGALPAQVTMTGASGLPVDAHSVGVATRIGEELDGASDPVGVEAALPTASQAEVTAQPEASNPLGVWQALPQPAAMAVMQTQPGPDGQRGQAVGQGMSATLAGGRQQLPPSLPFETADAQAGRLAYASVHSDAEGMLAQPLATDVTPRPVPNPVQIDAPVVPERPFEPARAAVSREVMSMQLPLRAPGWDGELAQRIVWMVGRQAQWAEISLNPPNLGNVEVHLSLKGNDASAYFYSPHAAVREAIDESLSRLREMLAGVGISLGQTQVSQESFGDRHGADTTGSRRSAQAHVEPEAVPPVRYGRGLVDLYV